MKILMLSSKPICPINNGERVRIYQIAKGLARYFEVVLIVPFDNNLDGIDELKQAGITVEPVIIPTTTRFRQLQSLLSHWPYHVRLRYHETLQKKIDDLLETDDYDLIYGHFIYALPYVIKQKYPIILDQHNVDRVYWRRKIKTSPYNFIFWVNWVKTRLFEERVWRQINFLVSVSKADQEKMQALCPAIETIHVAPNGVDLNQYQLRQPSPSAPLTIGFLGSLDLRLNHLAALELCDQIFPSVLAQLPGTELLIIGRNPHPTLQKRAQKKPQITVTGSVPDVAPYLSKVDILVLPLRDGAGTKLRVLEAMATGTCIIGTTYALEGIQTDGFAIAAETPSAFVQAIISLAQDAQRREAMGKIGRKLVEQYYSWDTITHKLATQIESAYY